jgi:hypothetical protein
MRHVAPVRYAELVALLDARADRLTDRVLTEMYADPFWYARFGERADRHGRQDGRFHIDYVVQALQANDAGIVEHYARWLQQVLTSRGMCTRHLAENFARLAEAIRAEDWPDGDAAIAMLDAARAALAYPDGPARDVQQAGPELAAAAAYPVASTRPANSNDAAGRTLAELVDYVADAIALRRPDGLARHVVWLAGFLEGRGTPRSHLTAQLEALAAAAPAILPGPAAGELAITIAAALTALRALPTTA